MQNKHINQHIPNGSTQTEREMNESVTAAAVGRSARGGGGRSVSDKERTKLRERQRRAITTKIFHGLRKWGGYHLSPRADINEVLRHLAKEAGWVIHPDGTTYRPLTLKPINPCPVCGTATPTTTTSSIVMAGGGGDCSTTASPRHVSLVVGGDDPNISTAASTTTSSPYFSSIEGGLPDIPLALYLYGGGLPSGPYPTSSTTKTPLGGPVSRKQLYLQEMRASNQNTPAASPPRRTI
ncbi:hypothetical protein ACOSQ3_011648 [Xanthoceras sorbifolium]